MKSSYLFELQVVFLVAFLFIAYLVSLVSRFTTCASLKKIRTKVSMFVKKWSLKVST